VRTMLATVTAFLGLAGAIGAQNIVAVDADTAALLIRNERALYDAITTRDKAAYQALVAPEGTWTTPAERVPMGTLADRLGAFELPKWGIEDPLVAETEGTYLHLLYTRTGGGRFGERPFAPLMLATTLWTKREGRWIAVQHEESVLAGTALIPEQAQWEITFARVEAAAGLADLRSAPGDAVEARVMDRPWSAMAPVPFLRLVRHDGAVRAQLFEFWAPGKVAPARRPAGSDAACQDGVCVRSIALRDQLDWAAIVATLTREYACGVKIGRPGVVCGDCDEVWVKTTAERKYREQTCQMPDAGTSAGTLLQFMRRSARGAAR